MADVIEIELASLRAWPATETANVCGWLFRSVGGYTKRANSANTIEPIGSFQDVKRAAKNFYKARGTTPTFRLSPLAPKDADSELDEAEYIYRDPSIVLSMPIACAQIPGQVSIAALPDESWLDGYATANRLSPHHRVAHKEIVHAIGDATGFATLFGDDVYIWFWFSRSGG